MSDEKQYVFNDFDKWRSGDWAVAVLTYVVLTFVFHFSWWGDIFFAGVAGSLSSFYHLKTKRAAEDKPEQPIDHVAAVADSISKGETTVAPSSEPTNTACPSCGAPRIIGTRFCGNCGGALATPAATLPPATPKEQVPSAARRKRLNGRQVLGIGAAGVAAIVIGFTINSLSQASSYRKADASRNALSYDDVLTSATVKTFASNNTNWNGDDPNNVAYVQHALHRPCFYPYGQTFGAIMSNQKTHEAASAPDVSYDDVLNADNSDTFALHNAGWKNDDPDNVLYVQRAMKRLGSNACGRKFGALMDDEKAYANSSDQQRHVALARAGKTDLRYDDVLTPQNERTFAQHNDGGLGNHWNDDDPNNVAYVQRAVAALGNSAYGKTFGYLMDFEKSREPDHTPKELLTGSVATLSKDVRPCFSSRDDYDDSVHAAVVNDRARVEEDLNNAMTLTSGTSIAVIDTVLVDGITEVRAQDGDSSGSACWALTSTLQQSVSNVSRP